MLICVFLSHCGSLIHSQKCSKWLTRHNDKAQPQKPCWQTLAVRGNTLATCPEARCRLFCDLRGLAINPVCGNGQCEQPSPAHVLRHSLDGMLFEACILRRLRHLRRFVEFGRGSPASSSTSLPPWTLSNSFEDGACRTSRRWRVVLATRLAVRSVLEQLAWLGQSDLMKRFIFTVIRKVELTSATWDTIWKKFWFSLDVMLWKRSPSPDRQMVWCGPRDTIWKKFWLSLDVMLPDGVVWPKTKEGASLGARLERCDQVSPLPLTPNTTRTTTCAGIAAWPAHGFETCCTQGPPAVQQSGRTSLGRMNCVSKGSRCRC